MLSVPSQTRVYLCTVAIDLRKSFDGLCGLVESVFRQNVLDGHLFLFVNKRRDRIKALWWDRDGLVIFYKRLERGTYEAPRTGSDGQQLELDSTELAMLLGGVTLSGAQRRPRYRVER